MRQLLAFTKKEWMELSRSGKLLILLVVFFLFGIMNPAIAKLTPWMVEIMAESLQETGLIVQEVKVDAMTSWTQFYKNVPIGLLIFVILFGPTLTGEYQSGTLICVLTKGLSRWKVLAAKGISMFGMWTLCYWLCFGVTCGYNEFFWGNNGIPSVFFGAACVYLLGVWCLTLILLMSALFRSTTAVLLAVGGVYAGCYLLSLFPKLNEYLPTRLMSAGQLLGGTGAAGDFISTIIVTCVSSVAAVLVGVTAFNRREIG